MDEDKQFYVYSYRDDEDNPVYIGHGCKGRAWHCGYMRGDSLERAEWKTMQLSKGLLPCDWVHIERRGLTKQEARDLEKSLIRDIEPELNKHHNRNYNFSVVSQDEINRWIKLRNDGLSYKDIAETSEFHTMTIWRALNDSK